MVKVTQVPFNHQFFLTSTLCQAVAVLLGSVGMSCCQDFQKGVTAYESGDYATALRDWHPFAEQGNFNCLVLAIEKSCNRLVI